MDIWQFKISTNTTLLALGKKERIQDPKRRCKRSYVLHPNKSYYGEYRDFIDILQFFRLRELNSDPSKAGMGVNFL